MGFCLVVVGIFIYNLKHPVERAFNKRTQEQRRERSIERLYSVATTKVTIATCLPCLHSCVETRFLTSLSGVAEFTELAQPVY